MWVYDLGYEAGAYASNVKRVNRVYGTGIVQRLVQSWPQVQGVYF
jgi:hypothetical protein